MVIDTPPSLTKLAHEVVEWMDGQRDTQFPFCDTYLMWNHGEGLLTYNCTFPYWREYGNTIMEDISITGSFREQIARIVVVKGTDKGIALPFEIPSRECYYIIKGNPPSIMSKNKDNLIRSLEVYEYKLYGWEQRKCVYEPTKQGKGYSSGNIWHQNLHINEGDIVVYVRYHDK